MGTWFCPVPLSIDNCNCLQQEKHRCLIINTMHSQHLMEEIWPWCNQYNCTSLTFCCPHPAAPYIPLFLCLHLSQLWNISLEPWQAPPQTKSCGSSSIPDSWQALASSWAQPGVSQEHSQDLCEKLPGSWGQNCHGRWASWCLSTS